TDLGGGVSVSVPAPKVVPPGYRLAPGVPAAATGGVGGTVPATLSLTVDGAASVGNFLPGADQDYTASTTASGISPAGDATLSVADPGANPGHLVNGASVLPQALQARANGGPFGAISGSPLTLLTYSAPVSNAPVAIDLKQTISRTDALRT